MKLAQYSNSSVSIVDIDILGWGLLKLCLLISLQLKFFIFQKYLLDYLNHIYIWQVPPQLSCGDTC